MAGDNAKASLPSCRHDVTTSSVALQSAIRLVITQSIRLKEIKLQGGKRLTK
jgi:hypothetical protein